MPDCRWHLPALLLAVGSCFLWIFSGLWRGGADRTWVGSRTRRPGGSGAGSRWEARAPLPFIAKVGALPWRITGPVLAAVAGACVWVLGGMISGALGDPGPFTRRFWFLTPLLVLFAAPTSAYFLWGAVRPEHVRVDEHGVSTHAWQVRWAEIHEVRLDGGRLVLDVPAGVADRYRQANRWHSGRPAGAGGLPAQTDTVSCQAGLRDTSRVGETIDVLSSATP